MWLSCSLSGRMRPTDAPRVSISTAQPAERAGRTRGHAERRSRVRQAGTPCTDRAHPGSETCGSDRAGVPSLGVRGAAVGEVGPEVLRPLLFELGLLFSSKVHLINR